MRGQLKNSFSFNRDVCSPYRLVGLEGGLKLQVVPVCQDEGEGGLIRAKPAFSCLTGTKSENITPTLVSMKDSSCFITTWVLLSSVRFIISVGDTKTEDNRCDL